MKEKKKKSCNSFILLSQYFTFKDYYDDFTCPLVELVNVEIERGKVLIALVFEAVGSGFHYYVSTSAIWEPTVIPFSASVC